MKKIFLGLLLITFIPFAHAQLGALTSSQEDRGNNAGNGGGSETSTPSEEISHEVIVDNDNMTCEDKIQNSIPLKFLTDGLLRAKNSALKITHNSKTGQIKIDGGSYIANCGDMLQWSARKPQVAGEDYLVELKIKRPKDCVGNECSYTVLQNGKPSESMKFSDNYAGFVQCLEKSGVLVKDENQNYAVEKNAIVNRDMGATLSGFDKTGKVRFVSYGPEAEKIGAKYSKVSKKNCFYTEKIASDDLKVFSSAEWTYQEKSQEVKQLCRTDNYRDIFDNIGKYSEFENILQDIGAKLIVEDVKKMAKTIESAKTSEDLENIDFGIIDDFQKHVVVPLTQEISNKFDAWRAEPKGENKEKLFKELKKLKEKLELYGKSPYLTKTHLTKLKTLGQFSPAKNLFLGLTQIEQFSAVGKIVASNAISPDNARTKVEKLVLDYENQEEKEKRDYEIINCDRVGEADRVFARAKYYQKRIQVRNKNYQQIINDLVQSMQTKCPRKFTQKAQQDCFQGISRHINLMKVDLQKKNKRDLENSQKLTTEAERLEKLEAKASKTCDKPPVTDIDVDDFDDSLNPSDDYDFDFDYDDGGVNKQYNQNFQNNANMPYQFNFNNQGQGYQSPFANGNSTMGLDFGMNQMNGNQNFWSGNQFGANQNGFNQFGGNQFGGNQFGYNNQFGGNQFGGNQFGGQFQLGAGGQGGWPAMNNMYQQPGMFNQFGGNQFGGGQFGNQFGGGQFGGGQGGAYNFNF